MQTSFIFGCSAQGRVTLDILREQFPYNEFFFVDEKKELQDTLINGIKVVGGIDIMVKMDKNPEVNIAIGHPHIRSKIVSRLAKYPVRFLNAIHPSAVIAKTATLGQGIMVGAGAIINTNATIGNFCIVNTGAIVEHDSILKDYVCISPGACVGGRVTINEKSFIGSGAVLMARVEVGGNSVIGMGSVVTKSIPEKVIAYGSPAKPIKNINDDYNWNRIL